MVDGLEVGRIPESPGSWASRADIADTTSGIYAFYARVRLGHRRVLVVTPSGDTLRGEFEARESADVFVSTSEGRIR